jgi:hypothetical protein
MIVVGNLGTPYYFVMCDHFRAGKLPEIGAVWARHWLFVKPPGVQGAGVTRIRRIGVAAAKKDVAEPQRGEIA